MKRKLLLLLGLGLGLSQVFAQNTTLNHLASYETGEEGSAEVVSYDASSQRAFFTSASNNSLSIINISDVNNPTLITEVSLTTYGGGPNSVAIANGIVAVAMEADNKQAAGKIIFFDTNGTYLNEVVAGALPDMITFTPNGQTLLVANEGEPSDDYTVDPEGSVSIVDLSTGVMNASVTQVTFTDYNDHKFSLMNKGVRIFGNNGNVTVAQDLEPEYITVSEDNSMAYVNCQENNAIVVVDIANAEVLDILPLGYKNHMLGTPEVESIILNNKASSWPSLGTPVYDGGQPTVYLGGFSGLYYSESESNSNSMVFYAVPDRGPNANAIPKADVTPVTSQNVRPFKLPNYQAQITKFTVDATTGNVTLASPIMLFRQDGTTPITGKGNIPGVDEVPVTYADPNTAYPNVDYTDNIGETYHELAYDEFGADLEGVLIDKYGNFWMCDEYRPAIYKFTSAGVLIERYVASGTSQLGTTPMPAGTYGAETLPAVYAKRRANRGFEAIAYDEQNEIIYAFIQSPMYNPSSITKNASDVIRILGIDANSGNPVSEYVYLLERNKLDGYSSARVDKIGDAVYTGNGKFLVIERDSEGPTVPEGKKYIFEIDINGATNVLGTALSTNDGTNANMTLEQLDADEIYFDNSVVPVHKLKVLNLPSVGYVSSDKAEGIALLPNNKIAVLNDNDFGIAGAGLTDNSVLGIISFGSDYGFDASNKDNMVNITAHPTLGMYMPDGISSYNVNGVTYFVTANEGDARDYDGYSEEVRVKDLQLDSGYYSNYNALQDEADLGRLKTTVATGDYDNDGLIEQIYSYGARSFSIFDQYGNLVFDSGDEFASIVYSNEPNYFNEDDGEMDGRSDDKGSEPEAMEVATIGNYTYAFIGLERQSAVLVYDITDPLNPQFITFYTNRMVDTSGVSGDISPEIIHHISAAESPNGEDLLLIGNEVSGSMSIVQVGGSINSVSELVAGNTFTVFPNPVGNGSLSFDSVLTGVIYSVDGQEMMRFNQTNQVSVEDLPSGVYLIQTENNGARRFVKF